MKEVKENVSEAKNRISTLDTQDAILTSSLDKERAEYDGLKEQAAYLDQIELLKIRLAIRPQMEREARERISQGLNGGKLSFENYQASIRNTDMVFRDEKSTKHRLTEKAKSKRNVPDKTHD